MLPRLGAFLQKFVSWPMVSVCFEISPLIFFDPVEGSMPDKCECVHDWIAVFSSHGVMFCFLARTVPSKTASVWMPSWEVCLGPLQGPPF